MSGHAALDLGQSRTRIGSRITALRGFLGTESGGAIVLLAAALTALAWVNSPWADSYHALWDTPFSISVGDLGLDHSLRDWVNDGLMALFFLLIGLEVRREFDMGEFRERRRLAVPVFAAIGGMVLPVLIFLALNAGTEAARGWAMVMATDTAFAVGVLALVGSRSSMRLRTFLLTLVIVDDVAAVAVIAVAYSADVNLQALLVAGGLLGVVALLRWRDVQRPSIYWLLAVAVWLAAWESGVHPTIAGVAMGLLTGAYPPRRAPLEMATGLTRAFRQRPTADLAAQASRRITMSLSPNERLQHALHPWTSFVVVPLFALANAGLVLDAQLLGSALGSSLVLGVVLGLVVGKPVGISLGAWLATRPRLGGARLSVGWPSLIAASSVAGIGFTMSLLIAELSYVGTLLDEAKLGILSASVIAAGLAVALFRGVGMLPADWRGRAEARTSRPVVDLSDPVDPSRDHVRGRVDAPVTLVEYGDFECPHCARAEPVVRSVVAESGGRVRLVFRHLPLTDVHPNAALAAQAAEAAAAQGRFWEMHDMLFEHQDALGPADLARYARQLGLDVEQFNRELRDGTHAHRVARDVSGAEEAGAAGTPTFFLDDVLLDAVRDEAGFRSAVAHAVQAVELGEAGTR